MQTLTTTELIKDRLADALDELEAAKLKGDAREVAFLEGRCLGLTEALAELGVDFEAPAKPLPVGTPVTTRAAGQEDWGVIVADERDEDGTPIPDGQIAVRVANGQGTWGFLPHQVSVRN